MSRLTISNFILAIALVTPTLAKADVCLKTEAIRTHLEKSLSKTCDQITSDDLATIKEITLKKVNIPNLKSDDFQGLISLKQLILDSNNLSSLPEDILQGLISLELFSITSNPIQSIPEGLFQNLSKIHWNYTHRSSNWTRRNI